jgi:tetratricopeptide (TPR) repeat protein
MKTKERIFDWAVPCVAFMAAALACSSQVKSGSSSNQSASAEISTMITYVNQGQYDEAVDIGLKLIRNDPSDEVVYQQIADVYLVRAQKDRAQREQWVIDAVSYFEKSLLFNAKDRDAAGVHLFQDARGYESAGDLSKVRQCAYYDRATKLLEDRVSLLQGDQITLAGRTFPLEPLRKENGKVLSEVKEKAAKSECR